MRRSSLLVLDGPTETPAAPGHEQISADEFTSLIRGGRFLGRALRYRDVRLLTYSRATIVRPFLRLGALRVMARGNVEIVQRDSTIARVKALDLVRLTLRAAVDLFGRSAVVRAVERDLDRIATTSGADPTLRPGRSLYLRTDIAFGVESGGSVGHIAGVVNNFGPVTGQDPLFLTTDSIPTVEERIEQAILDLGVRFWDFPEILALSATSREIRQAEAAIGGSDVAFIYQRYSLDNYLGVTLARRLGVPLVLEYNGSEVWISRHWGARLRHEGLAERIELANLTAATLVVVVSSPMLDELVGRGVQPARILVNPNGVDTHRYQPAVDGGGIRTKYSLDDHLVIGFIGTFGPWHGAEVLADAFVTLIRRDPSLREWVRLLMIGDGPARAETTRRLTEGGCDDLVAFAGRTAQADGPSHLASCDILVSPHVPNTDGTPFFGSPTKLFEYMAMGKPIVASDLEQIGEILEQDQTALLVPPGDVNALANGLRELIEDPDRRARLGATARQVAVERHTWQAHTERIVRALEARCA